MPNKAAKIATITPSVTAIIPPPIPGPMYAYEGNGKISNKNENKRVNLYILYFEFFVLCHPLVVGS